MPTLQDKFIPFFALAVGLIVMPIALLGWDLSFIPGDLGDTRFNIYILEHGYQFLIGQPESYWNAPFMYPVENVITISDNLIGVVPMYSTFRLLGLDIFTSFQLWVIITFALNFAAAYWLFRYLFENTYAAAIGAFIFAFSISLQSQMGHAQLFARYFIPLAFLFIFKFGKNLSPKYFFLSLLCVVGQFYNGIYLGMLLLLPYSALVITLVLLKRQLLVQKIKKLKWDILILVSISINLGLLYKLMWPYYERSLTTPVSSYNSIFETIPKVISYFFAKNGSLLWKSLEGIATDIPAYYSHQLFPGAFVHVSILATIILLIRFKEKIRIELILLFITGLITLLFFMRFGDFSLYQFIYKIPGFHSLHALARIIGIELLFLGLTAGFLVKYLIGKNSIAQFQKNTTPQKGDSSKRQFIVFSLIFGFVVIDNYVSPSRTYRTSKAIAYERVDALKSKMSHLPVGTIISYEPEIIDDAVYVHLDVMLATQALHLKCINGYSATSPLAFSMYWTEPNAENRRYWLNSLGLDPELPVVIK